MFKDRIEKLKKKMKEHPELTTAIATGATIASATTVAAIVILKKTLKSVGDFESGDFRLEEITGQTRENLFNDDNFALLKLTDDEYMYCRQNLED